MGQPSISIKAAVFVSLLSLVWCYHGNLHNTGKPGVHQRLCTVEPDHIQALKTLFRGSLDDTLSQSGIVRAGSYAMSGRIRAEGPLLAYQEVLQDQTVSVSKCCKRYSMLQWVSTHLLQSCP